MAMQPFNNVRQFQFNPQTVGNFKSADEAKAYDAAAQLKADVQSAMADCTKFDINEPGDFAKHVIPYDFNCKKSMHASTTSTDGGRTNFVQTDANQGVQYRVAANVAKGMLGGMGGLAFMPENTDVFSRVVKSDSGEQQVQALQIDKTSGLMSYQEFSIPVFPGFQQ